MVLGTNGGHFDAGQFNFPGWYKPTNFWIEGSDLPVNSDYCTSQIKGEKIYTFLNRNVMQYDTYTNIWTTLTGSFENAERSSSGIVGDNIYVFISGPSYNSEKKVVSFDTNTNLWTTKIQMNSNRQRSTASTVVNNIYVLGGEYRDSGNNNIFTNLNESYDVISNTFTTKANVPINVYGMASASKGNYIYATGGTSGVASNSFNSLKTFRYDTINNTWSNLVDNSDGCESASGCIINDNFYVVGGKNNINFSLRRYNITNNNWSNLQKLNGSGKYGLSSIALNENIYAIGGVENSGTYKKVEIYVP